MNRIHDIKTELPRHQIDGLLLTDTISRRFATGFFSSAGALLLSTNAALFITDSRYTEAAKAKIQHAEVIALKKGETYHTHILAFAKKHDVQTLGFEAQRTTQASFSALSEKLNQDGIGLSPADALVTSLRQIKSTAELQKIKQAQKITDAVFVDLLGIISPKRTEKELEAELIYRVLKQGGEALSFPPIVVSGARSSLPHGKAEHLPLSGFLTIDFGAVYDSYCSDMTRTVAIGTPTDEMCEIYNAVLRAQLAGMDAANAGAIGKQIDKAARDIIDAAGFGSYFGHGFGHGIGLEVHEDMGPNPREENPLPIGSVISAEPGIYLPGKFGVRIEDMLYLGGDKTENLTKSPKALIVL